MEENRELECYDGSPENELERTSRTVGLWALATATVVLLGLLSYAVVLVSKYVVYLGYLALVVVGIALTCAGIAPVILLVKWLLSTRVHSITAHGLAFKGTFGRPFVVSPMGAITSSQGSRKGGKEKHEAPTPVMLSLFDMIEQGMIAPKSTRFILGYELDMITLSINERLPTHLIGGKGRSGKSRRAIFHLAQDLIAGAKVTVCDPHGLGKRDALAKLLAPLTPWVTFACTNEDIERVTNEHLTEMRKRVNGESEEMLGDGFYLPRVIYYDEWSELMTRHGEALATLLKECLEDCSRSFGGVQGYATIIGQTWVSAECGGTSIRRSIHEYFVHNIHPEYAKFLMVSGPWKKAEELAVKNCYYKPMEGRVREIITPFVPDNAPVQLAEIMKELYPVQPQARPKEVPERRMQYDPSFKMTGPLAEQVAYYPSPVYPGLLPSPVSPTFEREIETPRETGNTLEALPRLGETRGSAQESGEVSGEGFTVQIDGKKPTTTGQAYTTEDETAIVQAAMRLLRETGKLTRSDIMERLGWKDHKRYAVVKAVCDKYSIAKQ